MPKTVTYNEFSQIQQNSITSLKKISSYKNMPNDLKDAVDLVTKLFENYDVSQFREPVKPMRKITGAHLTAQEILDELVDGSGYTKWKVEEDNGEADIDFFRDSLNLDVQKSDAKKFTASRNLQSKREVSFLIFTCLPGHVFVELHTDNVGYSSEKVLTNNNLNSYLSSQF